VADTDKVRRPNVVFVFGDQWRAQALGYAGDPNVQTPTIDALSRRCVNFPNAVAGCPVCSPYRASLLTGQYPLTHGVFVNDVYLQPREPSIANAFAGAGYDTAYIGKWHVDGHGRSNCIPPERHQGFDYWKVLECTHDYNHSPYYAGDDPTQRYWDGYDAIAQTRDACQYMRDRDTEKPFLLMLSWGPPHAPYETAPEEFRRLYDPAALELRPNVPAKVEEQARRDLAGYYAHCSALDACMKELLNTLAETGLAEETIFVFTSDHGDMLGSQGSRKKQQPWEESARVPFLLSWPGGLGEGPRSLEAPIDAPDLMPTLLGLCGIAVPDSVEGLDYSGYIQGGENPGDNAALLMCPHPFGQWTRRNGGKECRGVRTPRYTYMRDLDGPWLLFDNEQDPFQLDNLVDRLEHADVQAELDALLQKKLADTHDDFRPSAEYIAQWGYPVTASGTVPYTE